MTMTEVKYAFEVISTKDIPYFALMAELWGDFCEDLGENWPPYDGTTSKGQNWPQVEDFPVWGF